MEPKLFPITGLGESPTLLNGSGQFLYVIDVIQLAIIDV
jgi:hypothetical protein